MTARLKGSAARFRHAYIRRTHGSEVWHQILSEMEEEDIRHIQAAERGAMVPVAVQGDILAHLVERVFEGNRVVAEQSLRAAGREQADDMLDGVFSVFSRFVSPQQAFNRGGSIIGSVYEGVETEIEPHGDGTPGGLLTVHGLQEFDYVAPWISGWIERAIERFGGDSPTVRERSWDDGKSASPKLEFEVSW